MSSLAKVAHADTLDSYGGFTSLHIAGTGYFTTAKFGSRLMLVDPLGNAYFGKGADLTTDLGTTPGNIIPYASVYAYDSASSTFSANLNIPTAENITPNDVVNSAGVTAHNVNDAIYIGFARPFSMTYFNVNTLGVGGKVKWYYAATGGTWHLINGTGNPSVASVLNGDGSYNLDIGNEIGPDANGFYPAAIPTANLVQWWEASGWGASYLFFPSDLATATVNGSSALYYIKGVVTQQFTTSPKAGQVVDLTNILMASTGNGSTVIKYSVNGDSQIQRWYNRTMLRMQAWGLNLAPYDSFRLWQMGPSQGTNRVPEIISWQISRDSMEGRFFGYTSSTAVKDVYQLNGSGSIPGCAVYPGVHPDAFDPVYAPDMNARAAADNDTPIDAWTIAVDPEEADALFGFGSYWQHAHLGVVSLFDNPSHPSGTDALGSSITYADPNLYSKFAIADMLRYEYKGGGDSIPAFTISSDVMAYYNTYIVSGGSAATTALANLNSAWGMSYRRWTTNGGWGTGTGFMDEAGTSATNLVSHITNGCSGLFPISFHSTPAAIATDINAFEVLAAAKYGTVMHAAVHAQAPNTLVALFLYQPATEVAAGLGPYIDFAEIAPSPVPAQYGGPLTNYQEGVRIYNGLQKPIIYHDYHSANPDSPIDFGGTITGLTYSGGQTAITWSGAPYEMRFSRTPEFPGSTSAPCTTPTSAAKANWKTLWVSGDYTSCTSVGQPIRGNFGDYWVGNFNQSDTQALRGAAIANEYTNFNALQGSDGKYFIAGVSHWAWNDDSQLSGSEWDNFGFVTAWDNAYDGVEDVRAVGHDSSGYFVGGEARDYGNMIGPLSAYLLGLNNSSNLPGIGGAQQVPTTPTGLAGTATSSTSVSLTWNASTEQGGTIAGYDIFRNGTSIATSTTTSYIDNTVTGGNTYTYTVDAYDTNNNHSAQSSPIQVTTPPGGGGTPSVPTGLAGTATSSTSVSLTWNASIEQGGTGSIAGYDIYRNSTKVGTSTSTSYNDTGLSANTTYTYTVDAYDTNNNHSAQSSPIQVTTPPSSNGGPTIPTNLTGTATSPTSVSLSWTASTEDGSATVKVVGYDIFRNGTNIGTSPTSTYADNTVVANTTYTYTVDAFDNATPPRHSSQSTPSQVTTPQSGSGTPTTPTNLTGTATSSTSVSLSWTASTEQGGTGSIAGYEVYRDGTAIGTSTTTTYTDTTVVGSTTYIYAVDAYDTNNNHSAQSSPIQVTTPQGQGQGGSPTTPPNLSGVATSPTSVSLSWQPSTETGGSIAGYDIYRNGASIGTSTTTTYADTTVVANTTYTYTVDAFDSASPPQHSSQSTPIQVTTPQTGSGTPSTPTNLSGTAISSSEIDLTWNPSTEQGGTGSIAGYEVYRHGAAIGTSTITTFADNTVVASTTYTYSVDAYDTNNNHSLKSSPVSVTTPSGNGGGGSDIRYGSNIAISGTIYFLDHNGYKRPYTSAGDFLSFGFNFFSSVLSPNQDELNLPTGHFVTPMDGSLINDHGTVYIVSRGTKAGFTIPSVFLTFGYKWQNVKVGDVSFMDQGPILDSPNREHLAGTLVLDHGTVYLLAEDGKMGIPSISVFNSWGYNFNEVVQANSFDQALPMSKGIMQTRGVTLSPL